jgi:beta-lactamase class A
VRAIRVTAAAALAAGLALGAAAPAGASARAGAAASARAGQAGSAGAAAAGGPACVSAVHPALAARISAGIATALRGHPDVGVAVSDSGLRLACSLRSGTRFIAASAIKVTILGALLLKDGGPARLTAAQHSLAWAMITQSSNAAATALWNETGIGGVQRFLDRAGLTQVRLSYAWGLSQITAHDELALLRLLTGPGPVLTAASRGYVLYLMAHVEPGQRWGTPAGVPAGVTVQVKNGWLPYPTGSDWHVNSLGAFTGPHAGYEMAILTSGNPSMADGIATIQGAASVVNRDIAAFTAAH